MKERVEGSNTVKDNQTHPLLQEVVKDFGEKDEILENTRTYQVDEKNKNILKEHCHPTSCANNDCKFSFVDRKKGKYIHHGPNFCENVCGVTFLTSTNNMIG